MIRLSINEVLDVCATDKLYQIVATQVSDTEAIIDRMLEIEPLGDGYVAYKWSRVPLEEFFTKKEKAVIDSKLEDAMNTVINYDPFGGKFTGKTVAEACRSTEWTEKAVKGLKNMFLLDRVKLVRGAMDEGVIS